MKKILTIFVFILSLISIPGVFANSYGWGFRKNKDHLPPDIGIYHEEIKDTNTYYIGNPEEKVIYLTFDAGYDNGTLGKILDILKEKNVKATFFVTGDFLEKEKDLTLRMAYEGHIVANHSDNHKDITKLSDSELKEELEKVEEKYFLITGQKMTKFFRPPAGRFNKESLLKVANLGYTTFFWSIAYKDWLVKDQRGADHSYTQVMENLHNGAIILMHTVSSDNLEALPKIIDGIRNAGYEIKNLDYLVQTYPLKKIA